MRRTGKSEVDARRLTDRIAWRPDLGDVLGVLATTYDLQPDFIETDFLPNLFGTTAWDDRTWAGRIALERKLALTEAAVLLQDAHRYPGRPRSLRLEHRVAKSRRHGKLHAKVFLVVQQDGIRLVVGSANLTEQGYRRNREVVSSVVVTPKDLSAAPLIRQAFSPQPSCLDPWWSEGAGRVVELAMEKLEEWEEQSAPMVTDGTIQFVWSHADASLAERFLQTWPEGEPLLRLSIVSPFWSEESEIPGHRPRGPIAQLLQGFGERGARVAGAEINLLTDCTRNGQGNPTPLVPASVHAFDAGSFGVTAWATAVDPGIDPQEIGLREAVEGSRSLHAKIVVAEGEHTRLTYVGSANFTRAGWGLGLPSKRINIEAGLLVREPKAGWEILGDLLPETLGERIALRADATSEQPQDSPEVLPDAPWPAFLLGAELRPSLADPKTLDLVIRTDPAHCPPTWSVLLASPEPVPWRTLDTTAAEHRLGLDPETLITILRNQELWIRWPESPNPVRVPINVSLEVRTSLPLAPGSRGPTEDHLLQYYQGRLSFEDLFTPGEGDLLPGEVPPIEVQNDTVDTSRIQSYQMREFVESLEGIRQDLFSARSSEAAMRLAVLGVVSPVALAREVLDRVETGGRSKTAGAFQLVELLVGLGVARGWEVDPRCEDTWREVLDAAQLRIDGMLEKVLALDPELRNSARFADYQNRALAKRNGNAPGAQSPKATQAASTDTGDEATR